MHDTRFTTPTAAPHRYTSLMHTPPHVSLPLHRKGPQVYRASCIVHRVSCKVAFGKRHWRSIQFEKSCMWRCKEGAKKMIASKAGQGLANVHRRCNPNGVESGGQFFFTPSLQLLYTPVPCGFHRYANLLCTKGAHERRCIRCKEVV